MTVKVKLTETVKDVLAADSVLFTAQNRSGIEAFSLHNTTTTDITVLIYISPDDTSTSGKEVDQIVLKAKETLDVNSCIGQGLNIDDRVIGVADVVGVTSYLTWQQYTGSDA
jgi:hypothetical protein